MCSPKVLARVRLGLPRCKMRSPFDNVEAAGHCVVCLTCSTKYPCRLTEPASTWLTRSRSDGGASSLVAAKDSCSRRYRAPEIQRQRSNSCLTFGRDLASVRGEH